jgi:formylglycine-generating enzyme required for sulfatase activity
MPRNASCLTLAACWLAVWVGPLAAAEFRSFASGVMRGGERAEEIRVRVAGLGELVLAAVPVPTNESAHADWGDARLVAADGKVTYLSDLKPLRIDQPYGTPRMDRSHRGGPITIGPQTFRRGLGTHAPSQLVFKLDGKYEWLEAWVGIDVTAGQAGNVQFVVSDRPVGPAAVAAAKPRPAGITPQSLRLAIHDLIETFGPRYPRGREFLARLDALADKQPVPPDPLAALAREALLANPLLDFDRLLVVKRRPLRGGRPVDPDTSFGWDMGLPRSSAGNSALPNSAFDNEIAVLSPVSPDGKLTILYRPGHRGFVGDVDLEFNARKLLFSLQDVRGRWQICEIGIDGRGFRQVSRGDQPDVDRYDPCYLPDGRIVYCGSACFQGVPCNFSNVEVLYRMDADGGNVRQLCFEQDHDFNPVMMPSGRVMYLRWEYSDLPHSNARRVFSMNPDGTGQMAYYGSNSYWPNGVFGARPVPDRPGKFAGIVAGHHGSHREGELVLFDVGRGRHEADGAVQRIPGRGRRIEPLVRDQLTAASWPKFVHPYPLSDKYFLVTCKVDGTAPWDLYLVDVFDNLLLLHHAPGFGLFEPIPLRPTIRPPILPDKVDPARHDAVVYLSDVYRGPGLAGVPRGAVKRLRLFTYHFAYQGMGGLLGTVGLDGPWDIKRVLGTVPVEPDGSAVFRIPANTPISLQPLDAEGKALQLMRSWLVGMPGETVSCAGCHEHPSSSPVSLSADALRRKPAEITPWLGPPRNFSYKREVQPVIDRYCVGCHEGKPTRNGRPVPDLRGTVLTSDYRSNIAGNGNGFGGRYFSVGYFELSRFVRRPGIESDMHLLRPAEYHADTTELVRLLKKGHYNVHLDAESWDRLVTWIDLNAPYHGTWKEIGRDPGRQRQRRRELRRLYAGVDEDPELLSDVPPPKVEFLPPAACGLTDASPPRVPGWPMDAQAAAKRQAAAGAVIRQSVDLGEGVTMALVLIPPGEFAMGDPEGDADERPLSRVTIPRPFWIGACEVTNRQYARFDPSHDSRFESKNGYQFGVTGFDLSGPEQPVVRVSWQEAMAFCAWLSERTGRRFTLPTEAEWEYACRAGSATDMSFGSVTADFSPYANLADVKLQHFATDPYTVYQPLAVFTKYDDWIPRDTRYNDGGLVTVPVGRYRPNVWGLYDTHGNVAEWTRSTYRPYPYNPGDGRDAPVPEGKKVIRGGSWRDRPYLCRSASRWRYPAWQKVYNVGFRAACVPQ